MSPPPKMEAGSGDGGLPAAVFIARDTGNIKVAKLVSTLLGSVWITVAAGWIMVINAIVRVHLSVINAVATLFVRVLEAFGQGGAETLRESWRAAFLSAVEANQLLAPVMFSLEIVTVSALLLWARERWL